MQGCHKKRRGWTETLCCLLKLLCSHAEFLSCGPPTALGQLGKDEAPSGQFLLRMRRVFCFLRERMVFSCISTLNWLFTSRWECPRDKEQPVAADKPWVGSHPCGDSAWVSSSATTPRPECTQVALATEGLTQIRKNSSHALLLNISVLLIMEHQGSPVWRFPDFHDGIHLASVRIP